MKRHIGSTIALWFGGLAAVSAFAPGLEPDRVMSQLNAGIFIILGALAYRSAKKRKLHEVLPTLPRRFAEAFALVLIVAAVGLQKNALFYIATDPVPYLVIPLWVFVAYAVACLRSAKPKEVEADEA